MQRLRGHEIACVFQDPMSSLNPVLRIGRQLTEKVEVHLKLGRRDALALAEERLGQTRIPEPAMRLRQYPHEFSGGMRQRAMIAMGLMTTPALIVADEPTTALDVTVQAQILELLRELNERSGTAVLLISHDLAVVSELCSRVLVMYAGRIVETLDGDRLDQAAHPYTRALLGTMIDLDTDPEQPLVTIPGQPPALGQAAVGCPFAARCPEVMERCRQEDPPLLPLPDDDHRAACWARVVDGSVVGVERA
jgi:oligopeptide/dipeptide ABC transporter ATP-binding protein